MPVITCIEDLKRLHQKRTPKMFWDYCESGSYTEQTFRENTSDFAQIRLRQRVARDLSDRDTSGQMLGQKVTIPVALAPVGSTGMQHPDGEILAARAAARRWRSAPSASRCRGPSRWSTWARRCSLQAGSRGRCPRCRRNTQSSTPPLPRLRNSRPRTPRS